MKKKFLAMLLALTMALSLAACGGDSGTEEPSGGEDAGISAETVKIGLICVHDQNSGYDVAHIDGLTAACEELGIDPSQIVFKYNVAEDQNCYDAAVDLAEQGCNIIFSDSYGHQSFMQDAATDYSDVTFVSCTGDLAAGSGLDNYKNIFPHTYESRYVSGVVAGMKLKELMDAGTVTDPKIGYVGAYPYAEVVCGYTAFLLGIQSIVPEAYMEVQYTSSWYDLTAEGEAANQLMADGCVIIGQHADSTGAPSAVQAKKDAAKQKAEDLLAQWKAGDATEDSFAQLANENSTDTGSNTNGGLYTEVYQDQMVEAFNDWCFDAARKPGDTGIVETDYGYHIMYFVGTDLPYWEVQVRDTLKNDDFNTWYTEKTADYTAEQSSFGIRFVRSTFTY